MKKSALVITLSLIFFICVISSVIAENETALISSNTNTNVSALNDAKEKGYDCLNKVSNRTDISLQDAIFGTLAIGYKKNLADKIEAEKSTDSCWPKSGCTLKETAQVALAYQRMGKSNEAIRNWLISKNATLTELNWFLQIDITNHVKSQCTIKYDTTQKTITILEDMRISGDAGSCFTTSSSGLWLKIKDSCVNKKFDISCKQDFITNILYQKTNGATVYVPSKTQSSSADGTLTEEVNARCFKTGSKCDYEGSLWAAYALSQSGKDVSAFMPYLVALAEDNQAYFPSTLIYLISGGDTQFSNILDSQQQSRFWEILGSKYGKYYDTSLALLALDGSSATEYDNAKEYLIEIQQKDGCWNNDNLRDTSFILYSLWKKPVASTIDPAPLTQLCEPTFGYCAARFACQDAGGQVLSADYECTSISNICCSIDATSKTCAEKEGNLCGEDEECPLGASTQSSDLGTCCLQSCEPKPQPIENTCEAVDGPENAQCKSECSATGETEDMSYTCDEFSVCCVPEKAGSSKWIWIIILLILIILIALAIIYRDKIRLSWFKFKGKASSTTLRRPGMPPSSSPTMLRPQARPFRPLPAQPSKPLFGFIPRPATPVKKPTASKDSEMEDTLKKLREMSK